MEGKGGDLWFGARKDRKLVRFSTGSHKFTVFDMPGKRVPEGLAVDRDGFIWYSDRFAGRIGRLDAGKKDFVEIEMPMSIKPFAITVSPSGRVWFTEISLHKLGVVDSEAFSETRGTSVRLTTSDREALHGGD